MSDSKDMSDLDSSVVKKLNVPELRSELAKRGLDAKGLKQTLIDRLLASLHNNDEPVEMVTKEKASDSKLYEAVEHANQTDITNLTISSSLSGETSDTDNAFNGVQTAEADNYQDSTDQTAHALPVESTNSDTNNCEECIEVLCSEASNDKSSSSITDCKCFCGVLAAELEGIKLDIVILQKCTASNTDSTLESSKTNEEIERLNRELLHEKRKTKQLENNLSLVVRERNKEIEELNKTIYSLREKSIKSEQEKDSIMLAFNLVMQDKMQILNNNCHDKFHEQSWTTNKPTVPASSQKQTSPCDPERPINLRQNENLDLYNRFSVLSGDDHETTDTETKEDQYPQSRGSSTNGNTKTTNERKHKRKYPPSKKGNDSQSKNIIATGDSKRKSNGLRSSTVKETLNCKPSPQVSVVIGDSIVKNLQGPKLGKAVGHRVVVKSFSGATLNDMKSYIKPTLERSPDQIVLHIGTNDLKSKEPIAVADSIIDLAREIDESCDAEIIISELTTRKDHHCEAVKFINKHLNKFCNQNQWKIVHHANITQNELNRGGLHLNREGNELLLKNFVDCLVD